MFSRAHLLDIGERALATFIQTFIGIVLATGFVLGDVEAVQAAAVAALVAAVKGAAAGLTGAPDSASLLPARSDPPLGDHGHISPALAGVLILAAVLAIIAVRYGLAS